MNACNGIPLEQYVGGSPGHGSADEELPVEAGAMSPLTFTTPAGIPHTFQLVLSDEEKALAKAGEHTDLMSPYCVIGICYCQRLMGISGP